MMIGAKVKYKFLCFVIFALFLKFDARTRSQDLWPFLISETGLKLKAKFIPVTGPQGGLLWISSDGDDRMEPKVKTQKNP